jgi:hypothetical protein
MVNCYLTMLHVFYKQLNPQINDMYVMCITLTKSSLVLFHFFSPYVQLCCIDSGYCEASGLVKDSIQEMLEDLLQA